MERLTTKEILALAVFDESTLPVDVKSAFGKLMINYAAQLQTVGLLESLERTEENDGNRGY